MKERGEEREEKQTIVGLGSLTASKENYMLEMLEFLRIGGT